MNRRSITEAVHQPSEQQDALVKADQSLAEALSVFPAVQEILEFPHERVEMAARLRNIAMNALELLNLAKNAESAASQSLSADEKKRVSERMANL